MPKNRLFRTPTDKRASLSALTPIIYLGPTEPGGRLSTGQIILGAPAYVKNYFEDLFSLYPDIEKLMIPLGAVGEFKSKGIGVIEHYTNILKKQFAERGR